MVGSVGRIATGVAVGLAGVAGLLFAATPAAAQGGYQAQITELPDEAVAGEGPVGMTVVVSRDLGGDCEKVRWSLLLRVDGVEFDQIRAARVEQGQAFAVDVQIDDDTARLTDIALDPGTLCQDRTVTAQYQFSFTDDAEGRVTLTAEAYDEDVNLLADTAVTLPVVTEPGGSDPEPTESVPPVVEDPAVIADAPAGTGGGGPQPVDAIPAGDTSGIPVAWFIVGGAMVFVGFGLLMRVRARLLRSTADPDGPLPATGAMPVGPSGDGWRSAADVWQSAAAPSSATGWGRSRSGRSRWR